jgi:histone deacetylase complex regulatory component SIN3
MKQTLRSKDLYADLLKVIAMFSKDIISKAELEVRSSPRYVKSAYLVSLLSPEPSFPPESQHRPLRVASWPTTPRSCRG